MKNKLISVLYPFKMIHHLTTITVIIGFCLGKVQGQISQGMWMASGNSTFSTSDYSSLKLALGTELGYMASNKIMVLPSIAGSELFYGDHLPFYAINFGFGLRYYYLNPQAALTPFIQAKADTYLRNNFSDERSPQIQASTGANYFITPNLALEAKLFYNWSFSEESEIFNSWGGGLTLKTFFDLDKNNKKRKKTSPDFKSPIQPGTLLLGGSIHTEGQHAESRNLSLSIQPSFGVAVSKNLILGINPGVRFYYDDVDQIYPTPSGDVYIDIADYYVYHFYLGGYARFVVPTHRKIIPFAEVGYYRDFILDAVIEPVFGDMVSLLNLSTGYGAIGIDYFFQPRIALEVSARLEDQAGAQSTFLQIGVQTFIGKTKKRAATQKGATPGKTNH